ncbi:MAG TPA: hypothetical protein VKP61_17190 [Candidatus Acidoferrum sp.]|jgi:hypothetical protein|nr:hypothetical protein [Candidatus Acidoferrum sp.]
MFDYWDRRILSKYLHSKFYVQRAGAADLELELFEIEEKHVSPRMEEFLLLFRGPLAPVFTLGIRTLEHDKLGPFDIFLVPMRPDSRGMRYQAAFTRFRKAEDNR